MIYFRQLCFSCSDGSLVHITHTFLKEVDADSWLDKYLALFSEFSPSFDSSCLDDDRSFLDGDLEYDPDDDFEYIPVLDRFVSDDDFEDFI